jgi:hypothetical protein
MTVACRCDDGLKRRRHGRLLWAQRVLLLRALTTHWDLDVKRAVTGVAVDQMVCNGWRRHTGEAGCRAAAVTIPAFGSCGKRCERLCR